MNHLSPAEVLNKTIQTGIAKANGAFGKLFILGILAGAYIAFAGFAANLASCNLMSDPNTFGVGRALAGTIFTTGLAMVVLGGGELFTGNSLIMAAVLDKKVQASKMVRNWIIVYASNFVGAVLVAYMASQTDLFSGAGNLLGAYTIKVAVGKVNITFIHGLLTGILCNWLVSLAVWMGTGADSTVGKVFAMFFPIWIFVISGFEHCIANMYFIPAGIFLKGNELMVEMSGASAEALANLSWGGMFLNNMLPVTIGNIIGGGICVGAAYWVSFKKFDK